MALYLIGFLGQPDPALQAEIEVALRERLQDLKLDLGTDVEIVTTVADLLVPSKAAKVAAFFCHTGAADSTELSQLVTSAIPILPLALGDSFKQGLPPCLANINGIAMTGARDEFVGRISTCILESLGLLRAQRKVFISYRQLKESRPTAVQLFEELSARKFDVFLDSHDVQFAQDFQEQLWHRLSDCDVLVMLDTPDYFKSRWTYEEFGRAEAKSLAILRVGWPGHLASQVLRLGEDLQLVAGDIDANNELSDLAIQKIACAVERLRAKSIAVRHAALSSAFIDAVTFHRGTIHGVSVSRNISATLANGHKVVGVPAIGIPTSESLQHAWTCAAEVVGASAAIVYDHVGMQRRAFDHLQWLHTQVKDVRWVWATRAPWDVAGL